MTTELDVLGLVSDRLEQSGVPFMLTGSFALAFYATPRMTRDLDIVIALNERDVEPLVAFARRQPVAIAGIQTWIVSREDLILSKLVWALQSNSELQRRDVQQLLVGANDIEYIHKWASQLGVTKLLDELLP